MAQLAGKHVVVTGGTGELGTAVCDALIARGAICHVPMRRAFAPEAFPFARHDQVVLTAGVDLADEARVAAYYRGRPPLWASIHTAGGFAASKIDDTTLAQFEEMWRINTASCFVSCREAVTSFRRGKDGGRIVNVVSRNVLRPVGGMVAYIASKAAIAGLTEALAEETRGESILVNAIAPAVIDTPANRAAMPDADVSRWTRPAELAELVAYLVSPANTTTTGSIISAPGRA